MPKGTTSFNKSLFINDTLWFKIKCHLVVSWPSGTYFLACLSIQTCLISGENQISQLIHRFIGPGINRPIFRTVQVWSKLIWWDLTLETYPHYWHDKQVESLTPWTLRSSLYWQSRLWVSHGHLMLYHIMSDLLWAGWECGKNPTASSISPHM